MEQVLGFLLIRLHAIGVLAMIAAVISGFIALFSFMSAYPHMDGSDEELLIDSLLRFPYELDEKLGAYFKDKSMIRGMDIEVYMKNLQWLRDNYVRIVEDKRKSQDRTMEIAKIAFLVMLVCLVVCIFAPHQTEVSALYDFLVNAKGE